MAQIDRRDFLVGVRLTSTEYAELEKIAQAEDRSKGAILRRALRLVAPHLDKHNEDQQPEPRAAA